MTTADRQLAADLGLPFKSVRAWRAEQLEPGTHYTENPDAYTPDGIARIRELAGLPGEPEETATPAPAPAPFEILTVMRKLPNPTWCVCKDPAGKIAQLRVRSSQRLRPGMKLQAVRDPATPANWKCTHAGFAAR